MLPPPKRDFHSNTQTSHNFKSDENIRHLSSRSEKRRQRQQITPHSSRFHKFEYGNSQEVVTKT